MSARVQIEIITLMYIVICYSFNIIFFPVCRVQVNSDAQLSFVFALFPFIIFRGTTTSHSQEPYF